MSLLILGPNAPRKDIDVFLRPLIDEVKELRNVGVENYDASTQSSFKLHVAVCGQSMIFLYMEIYLVEHKRL